jgi:hypothetical protein
MKAPKTKMPPIAAPVPVPQLDSPALVDVARSSRRQAADREGNRASLLTPGGARGVEGGGGGRQRRTLGYA